MQVSADLLPIRRSMYASPAHLQVHAFLGPIGVSTKFQRSADEALADFQKIVEIVGKMIQGDPHMAQALDALGQILAPPIRPEYMALYHGTARPDAHMMKTLICVVFARAMWTLQTSNVGSDAFMEHTRKIIGNSQEAVAQLTKALGQIDPDFASQLVTEAEIRAQEDPQFAETLDAALHNFWKLKPQGAQSGQLAVKPDPGLAPLGRENQGQWWFMPTYVAFAIGMWPEA